MKKLYMAPSLRWMEAQTEKMIAVSLVENGFTKTSASETEATYGNLSRRHSEWDDDEEE